MSATVRYGVVGPAGFGASRCRMIMDNPRAELVAVASRSIDRGAAAAQLFSCTAYQDVAVLAAREDIDVVAIYTPTGTHEEVAVAAAEAGKHVLLTKPLAISLASARRIVDACAAASVELICEFSYRYLPGCGELRALVRDGSLGTVAHAEFAMYCYRPDSYYAANGGWRGTWGGEGGGAVINQGVHALDQMIWCLGMPASVAGASGTFAHAIEAEDAGAALFRFADGGFATFTASTTAVLAGRPSQTGYGPTLQRSAVYGSAGSAEVVDGAIAGCTVTRRPPSTTPVPTVFDDVADLVLGTAETISDRLVVGADCLAVMEVVDRFYHSARTGTAIEI